MRLADVKKKKHSPGDRAMAGNVFLFGKWFSYSMDPSLKQGVDQQNIND
jgi:hypothetical protein